MNVSPDQVRAATRIAAAVITPDDVPPLRLHEAPGSHGLVRRTRMAWVVPLAAAAAVVIVVVGSMAAGSWLARPGNGQSSNPGALKQGASAGSYTGVPAYYVAVENPSLAVVRATATGATLARITTRTPFVGVTGAADDRTFVLDAQRQVMGPTVQWLGQPAFYLLRLSASGAEESFTRLAIPALPKGTAVTGLALSPDGSKLAVEVDSERNFQPGLLEIRVYTLATGAFRTWFTNGSTDPKDPGGFTGSGVDGSETISWAADSTTLAFDWRNQSYIGVRLLDTTASGDNLIADSRLAVIQANLTSQGVGRSGSPSKSKDHISQCVTDSIISLDGSAIVCGYTTTIGRSQGPYDTTTGFIRYSTRTGKPTLVFGVFQYKGEAPGGISLYWTDPAGKTLIGGILTPSGIRVGVINGGTFTPLPGITGLGAAAW
ncbi:MAG TPA: hypothetical protein VE733_30810 [Streptosporangiaceae bacterium]|jgi:hypothetical protein|nr:hypothetical protein [Streptosporangiaceae bacterium]